MTVKTVVIGGKLSDRCRGALLGEHGKTIEIHDGYVPQVGCFNEGEDCLYLEIDNETGVVKNWKPISAFRKTS